MTVEYGHYLTQYCHLCHGPDLAGGSEGPGSGVNLTPGGELGTWTEADFIKALRMGVTPTGRYLNPEMMPWKEVGQMTDDELKAIWLYLQSLPAIKATAVPYPGGVLIVRLGLPMANDLSINIRPETHQQDKPPRSSLLRFIRAAWILLTLLVLALFVLGTPGRSTQLASQADYRSLFALGFSAGTYAGYLIGLSYVLVLTHVILATLIFIRRPDEWIALFVAFTLVTNGALISLALMPAPEYLNATLWDRLVELISLVGLFTSVTLLYVFPDGRPLPSWTRWVAGLWFVLIFLALFFPGSAFSLASWSRWVQIPVLLLFSASGVFAQLYRYENVSTPTQKQQTKWASIGLAAAAFGPLVFFWLTTASLTATNPDVSNLYYQRIGASFFSYSLLMQMVGLTFITAYLLFFPISFAIAILRYRLWDIDILIRRTLGYSLLTAFLAVIYIGCVLLLQNVFNSLTGENQPETVTILSTLAIAALFSPLRRRVQNGIDRRFYRQKYDMEKTLAAFTGSLRDEVELDTFNTRLLAVVERTMQPECILLWLRPTGVPASPETFLPRDDD